jgi:hypothetical protein
MEASPPSPARAAKNRTFRIQSLAQSHNPILMFALGVISAIIAVKCIGETDRETNKRLFGLRGAQLYFTPPTRQGDLPGHWRSASLGDGETAAAAREFLVLEGVSAEMAAVPAVSRETTVILAEATEKDAARGIRIALPISLEVGDVITLTAATRQSYSFRVLSRGPAFCELADASKHPVADTALLACNGKAATSDYVIEAVEPEAKPQEQPAPRSL